MKTLALTLALVLTGSLAFAGDVTIKDVPEGAEADVKRMAAVAVERYLRQQLVVPQEVLAQVERGVREFKESNEMIPASPVEVEAVAPEAAPVFVETKADPMQEASVNFASVEVIN